jgi:hypothetical protein
MSNSSKVLEENISESGSKVPVVHPTDTGTNPPLAVEDAEIEKTDEELHAEYVEKKAKEIKNIIRRTLMNHLNKDILFCTILASDIMDAINEDRGE